MKYMQWLAVAGLLATASTPLSAGQVLWTWSFGGESGNFITDGAMIGGSAPAATYNVLDLKVGTSSVGLPAGTMSGGTYNEGGQPGTGWDWDGSTATMMFRDGGSLTNGINYYSLPDNLRILFFVSSGATYGTASNESTGEPLMLPAALTLTPIRNLGETPSQVPEPGTLALLGAGGAALLALKRRA